MGVAAATAPASITICCCSSRRTTAAVSISSRCSLLGTLFTSPRFCPLFISQKLCSLGSLSRWSGLKHLGVSSRRNYVHIEKKGKCHGKAVYASLFGVGAPEALVIGVVALLVFGPKGLAEVARNLGKTLRAFQPTIKELQEVSREFKSTLEREIGLDELASSTNNITKSASSTDVNKQAVADPNGKPSTGPYTSEELLEKTGDQLVASAAKSQVEPPTAEEQDDLVTAKPQVEEPGAEEQPEVMDAKSHVVEPAIEEQQEASASEILSTNPANETAFRAQVNPEVQSHDESAGSEVMKT